MTLAAAVAQQFEDDFGGHSEALVFAPGRVEVLGNHTDYNGGYVLPAAIEQGVYVAARPITGDIATVVAADFDRRSVFSVSHPQKDDKNSWASYVIGVVDQLRKAGIEVGAFEAVIMSDVPAGAGLSSSAAIEVAIAVMLQTIYPYTLGMMELAKLCQKAENQFVGVNCGLMDQFSSVFGQKDSLLFLDCKTLEHETVKMGHADIDIVICDSGVKHALTGGDYNIRRAECMAAAAHFGVDLLRDVSWDDFVDREMELPLEQRKRARHILTENARVLALREAIQGTDMSRVASIIYEGHASCRDLFENSTPELDLLVEIASRLPGCCGARMTGGGWGGSTLNLVQHDAVAEFSGKLTAAYRSMADRQASIVLTRAAQGARPLGHEAS